LVIPESGQWTDRGAARGERFKSRREVEPTPKRNGSRETPKGEIIDAQGRVTKENGERKEIK
jgi:hypothetical protein